MVTESITEDIAEKLDIPELSVIETAPIVVELPENIVVTESDEGKRIVTKKRVIKKKSAHKEELVEVITVQEDDKVPETTITVTEQETPCLEADAENIPKPKKKRVKKIKVTDDNDDIIERLLNLEVEKLNWNNTNALTLN